MGSHFPCRSIWNQVQNWIKRSKAFLRANQGIKVVSELQKSKDQECMASIWPFTVKIKQSRALEEMIKQPLFID